LAPPNCGGLNSTHIHGTHVPVEEPSTASIADIAHGTTQRSVFPYGSTFGNPDDVKADLRQAGNTKFARGNF
jgi:hypothetical protein